MNDAPIALGPITEAERRAPHVYARDITSGAGNCVCGSVLGDPLHTEAAPGIPVPELMKMVAKAAEPQRFVLGIAYQAGPDPRIKRGVDGGRDYFTKEELEKACWSYMRSGAPQMNAFHVDGTEDCAEPVESFIWRWPDWDAGDGIVVKDGDWCLGAILSPRMWGLYKDGKVNGLSPEGTARRHHVAKEGVVPVAKGFEIDTDEDDGELTALTDANFKKVALVGSGANGIPRFLIAKDGAGAGLVDADTVRGLIAKTSPEEAPVPQTTEAGETTLPNGIVIKGSPAAMAEFLNARNAPPADQGEKRPTPADVAAAVSKADMSAKAQNDLPDSAFAYVEPGGKKDAEGKTTPRSLRHFNVSDKAHADNAAARIAQGAEFGDKAKPKVEAAQRKFGEQVSKEAGVPDAVTKDMGPELDGDPAAMDGLDVTMPLAEPAEMPPGDPTDPGSPAWEGVDAASAQKWLSVAARLKNALGVLAEREMLEAASADPDDIENAWDLQDAMCAVDFAIEQLAVFAAGEQAEAELGAECEAMCKALAGFDPAPLAVFEGLAEVRKAGRVLSAANESAIRSATESLQKVLASLPEAPVAKEKEAPVAGTETAADVAKEAAPQAPADGKAPAVAPGTTGMGEPRETGPAAALPADGPQAAVPGDVPGRTVVKAAARLPVVVYDRQGRQCVTRADAIREPVAKADGDAEGKMPMQAVFDEDGALIGIVDPADITPVSGTGKKADPGEAAAAPAGDDMQPQPPADAGTPADAVGKAAEENVITLTQDVAKAIAEQAARTAIEASEAAHAQVVAKMAADNAGLAGQLEAVTKRLETVENSPAAPGVFTNGAVPPEGARPLPPQGQLRGQDQGTSPVDLAKSAEVRKQFLTADPAEQNRLAAEMQRGAIATLAAIHGTPVPA